MHVGGLGDGRGQVREVLTREGGPTEGFQVRSEMTEFSFMTEPILILTESIVTSDLAVFGLQCVDGLAGLATA